MTLAERTAFSQGIALAFMIAADVQRQAIDHISDRLGGLERSVERLEDRPQRRRLVRRLERVGFRHGEPIYRIA